MQNKTQQLVENFLAYHKFSKSDLCRLADIDLLTLEKILNQQQYVSIFEYEKLAHVLNVDTTLLLDISSTKQPF